jgi:hypothetical protein
MAQALAQNYNKDVKMDTTKIKELKQELQKEENRLYAEFARKVETGTLVKMRGQLGVIGKNDQEIWFFPVTVTTSKGHYSPEIPLKVRMYEVEHSTILTPEEFTNVLKDRADVAVNPRKRPMIRLTR